MKVPLFEAQTEWNEPEEYPDLRQYDEVAIDLETRDPNLKTLGSGSVIGNGEVVGIAVAVPGRKILFSNRSWLRTQYGQEAYFRMVPRYTEHKSYQNISQCNVRRMLD